MSERFKDGGAAFPNVGFKADAKGVVYAIEWRGMSQRDFFAAVAMHAELVTAGALEGARDAFQQGMAEHGHTVEQHLAFNAYNAAEAMVAESERRRKRDQDEQPEPIAHDVGAMVDRFLGWPLPRTFAPDCGISFDGRKDDEWNKGKTWPIGTNLFTADEARQMFEHALEFHPKEPSL